MTYSTSLPSLRPFKSDGIQPNFIAITPDRKNLVGCHNLSSARAYASGRVPCLSTEFIDGHFTYNCKAFVSPTGQFYVEIHAGMQKVRMDVANAQTARYYVKNGVDTDIACEAYLSNLSR